ncbi:MAG: hypothetical protein AAGD00_07515 [Planctomycetota bacterium]
MCALCLALWRIPPLLEQVDATTGTVQMFGPTSQVTAPPSLKNADEYAASLGIDPELLKRERPSRRASARRSTPRGPAKIITNDDP